MKKYNLTISMKEVSEWSKKDGQGEQLHFASIGLSEQFETEKLSIEDILITIGNLMYVDIQKGNLNFCNDEYANFDILENDDGEQDEKNGKFLARYEFYVNEVEPKIDLEKLFSNI